MTPAAAQHYLAYTEALNKGSLNKPFDVEYALQFRQVLQKFAEASGANDRFIENVKASTKFNFSAVIGRGRAINFRDYFSAICTQADVRDPLHTYEAIIEGAAMASATNASYESEERKALNLMQSAIRVFHQRGIKPSRSK